MCVVCGVGLLVFFGFLVVLCILLSFCFSYRVLVSVSVRVICFFDVSCCFIGG